MAFLDENGLNYLWNKVIERINLAIGENIKIFFINIQGEPYKVKQGMTWSEWVNSKYNTDGFKLGSNNILDSTENYKIVEAGNDWETVRPDEEISSSCSY